MAPIVLSTLREWKLACPKGALGLVFPSGAGIAEPATGKNGEPIFEPACDPRGKPVYGEDGAPVMKPVMKPKYGLHSLRHFFASWAIEQGLSPKRLQALLGHSSITMTFDTYGHLFPSLEDDHAKFAAGEARLAAAGAAERC